MALFALREHLVNGGRIDRNGQGYRLTIPPTPADAYVDAQLDDYAHTLPRYFTNHPPLTTKLRVRFSHKQIKGTAGFGFWNHPFSREGKVVSAPCNVWFFYSSPESNLELSRGMPGYGFKASMLNSNRVPQSIVTLGSAIFSALLQVPIISKLLMSAAREVVSSTETSLEIDMTEWHEYTLHWQKDAATFVVDGRELLHAPYPPQTALGFAAWIDNYRASAGGSQYEFAYVEVQQDQWMDIEIIECDE